MKEVNLRELYPDVYKTDCFVEVTEDVLAVGDFVLLAGLPVIQPVSDAI